MNVDFVQFAKVLTPYNPKRPLHSCYRGNNQSKNIPLQEELLRGYFSFSHRFAIRNRAVAAGYRNAETGIR